MIILIAGSFSKVFSQDIQLLLHTQESMDSCLNKKDYLGAIKYADFLINEAPKNTDFHAWAYFAKVKAQIELGDYRNVIINTTKALTLETEVALMIRQPDLPELIEKMKSINYLIRGMAKESIGLIESAKLDYFKAKENRQ